PLAELKRGMGKLPKNRAIVAYCRGPYCVLAAEAVAILKKTGYRAVRLEEGVNEWKQAGLPVESGNGRPVERKKKARTLG
ncbi:MAG: rhodanese-like domain-containing protein, partial [Nitrososphaerales archaeon]